MSTKEFRKRIPPSAAAIVARLREALRVNTQRQLAEFLGVRQGNVSQAIAGDRVPDLWLYKVSYATGRSIDWLRTGSGDPSHILMAETVAHYGPPGVPVLTKIPAGPMASAIDLYPYPGAAEEYLALIEPGRPAIALRVRGDSMAPEFREGDYIIVALGMAVRSGDLVVAVADEDGEGTFKQYAVKKDGAFLEPLNPDYRPITMTPNYRIVGKVVRLVRNY